MHRLGVLVLSFTALAVPSFTRADDALATALRVVASSGVGGHFADPVCEGGVSLRPAGFSRFASVLSMPSAAGEQSFVVDTGGLVQPHGVARHAVIEAPATLAALIDGLGYDVLAFGYRDLEGERTQVLDAARSLMSAGVPYVLSNLTCEPDRMELCEVVHDGGDGPLIFEHANERIAFLAFIDPAALRRVTGANKRGLRFAPLLESVRDGVRLARARGATIVIVSVDNGVTQTAIPDALSLAEGLEEDAKPDLLLAARAGENMLFTRPASFRPAIAAAPPAAVSVIDIRRNVETQAFDMLVSRPRGDELPSPATLTFIETIGAAYCEAYGQPLEGGALDRPIDAGSFFELATASVREASGAEIAVLNRGAVEETFTPMRSDRLTRSDVHLGLRYDEHIVVATVDADYLKLLARALAGNASVAMLGLAITNPGAADEAITINGRPLDPRGRYTVATVQFIADGGDGLAPAGAEFTPLRITVREAIFRHLGRTRTTDPRDDFVNPADRLAFAFTIQSDATFGGTIVHNEPEFDAAQLARDENITVGTQNTLTLSAQSTAFAWDSSLVARYRRLRTAEGTHEEADDLLSFRSNARYRGWRSRIAKVYVPEPFAELYFESEFTIPEERDYRHFLLRPTLGMQFTLTPQLGFRLNSGFEVEALDPERRFLLGVGGQLLLTPWTFFASGKRTATLGGQIDYFASDLGEGRTNRQELRASLDFSLVLSSYFGLAFTSTLFGLRERGTDVALAFTTTASVRIGWYVRTQR